MARKKKPQIDVETLLMEASGFYERLLTAITPLLKDRSYGDSLLVAASGVRGLIRECGSERLRQYVAQRGGETKTFPNGIEIVEAERPE